MLTNNQDSLGRGSDDGQYAPPFNLELTPWIDVARVANLAEAGFIVDELVGLGFYARLHQIDEFRAAVDRWSAQYLIRVPEEFAAAAAEHIGEYLSEEPLEPRTVFQRLRESVDRLPSEGASSWRPILIVMLVAVTGFLLGHQTSDQAAPRQIRSTDLAAAIARVGRPFSSGSSANQSSYRLSFDQSPQLWTLDIDRDHDGVYESTQHFTATGVAR